MSREPDAAALTTQFPRRERLKATMSAEDDSKVETVKSEEVW